MPKPKLLSQKDPRWREVKVGDSPYTVGQVGCTITAIAMFSTKDPGWMARNLEFVDGANLVFDSTNKIPDLSLEHIQWSDPKKRILEGLKKDEAIIVEVPANNQYGGKHWVAVDRGDDTGMDVVDPDMDQNKGILRYQSFGSVSKSIHFKLKKSNTMTPQELLNNLLKEKINLTNISNGQDWTGRLQGLINDGNTDKFYSELFDVLRWSQNKVELIDNPKLVEKIEELEGKLAEAPESSVIEQLQSYQETIKQLEQRLLNCKEGTRELGSAPTQPNIEELAELTSEKLVKKLGSKAQNFGKYIETNLPLWKRNFFDSLQAFLPSIGAGLVLFGFFDTNPFQDGTDVIWTVEFWDQVLLGLGLGGLGYQQISAKNKRKIGKEKNDYTRTH